MPSAFRLVFTIGILTSLALPGWREASAQGTPGDVIHDGLIHQALGSAVVGVDAARRLPVHNLGSSGQDGVEIKLADGARGYAVSFPNYDAEFTAGTSHTFVVIGTVAGASVPVAKLHVSRLADDSEILSPDFSGAHAATSWLELLDAQGAVIARKVKTAGYDLAVAKKLLLAASPGRPGAQMVIGPPLTSIRFRSPRSQSIEMFYSSTVLVHDGSTTTECRGLRFFRDGGDDASTVGPIAINGAWPASGGPGTFTIDDEAVDPPCAGINCPNGPGVELEAIGDALWVSGGLSSSMAIDNLGSSGQDSRLRESPTLVSTGTTRPPIKQLSLTVSNAGPSSSSPAAVQWDAYGVVGGASDQHLGTVSMSVSSSSTTLVPDFSSSGASGYRVVLYLDGAQVADIADPAGPVSVAASMIEYVVVIALRADGRPKIIFNCRTPPCPGETVIVPSLAPHSANFTNSSYVANEIDFEPMDPLPGSTISVVDDITDLDLHASGAGPVTIDGGDAVPFTPFASVPSPGATADFGRPQLSPNPAFGTVRVEFGLPIAARTRVSVADVSGRSIRTLVVGTFAAGRHELSWDGRSDAGRKVAPGVYFVRVTAGGTTRVARVTRLW